MNPLQPALIRAAIGRLTPNAAVRIATDADEEGAGFAATIKGLAAKEGRGDLSIVRAAPTEGKDWNDVLQRTQKN